MLLLALMDFSTLATKRQLEFLRRSSDVIFPHEQSIRPSATMRLGRRRTVVSVYGGKTNSFDSMQERAAQYSSLH
jgi:hypothetical protein